MVAIFYGMIILALMSGFSVVSYSFRKALGKNKGNIKIFEPDLYLVDKPELVALIPENDDLIPDANASKESLKGAAA